MKNINSFLNYLINSVIGNLLIIIIPTLLAYLQIININLSNMKMILVKHAPFIITMSFMIFLIIILAMIKLYKSLFLKLKLVNDLKDDIENNLPIEYKYKIQHSFEMVNLTTLDIINTKRFMLYFINKEREDFMEFLKKDLSYIDSYKKYFADESIIKELEKEVANRKAKDE